MVSPESSEKIHKRLDDFSGYLRKKGLKLTSQRMLVARKIFGIGSHFTVDHLADMLKKKEDKISRATIYRIVSVMAEAGLLIEHNFGQSAKFYEHTSGEEEHHDHMICVNCRHIEEFYDKGIEDIQVQVANKLGFDLAEHSLNLYGACRRLKNKGSCLYQKENKSQIEKS